MKILVVDDAELNNIFLGRLLTKLGHEVSTSLSGAAALASLKPDSLPEVIFLDWMMPGMDGIEVLQKIRKIAGETRIFIVMVTARTEDEDRTEALNAGVDIHLAKPIRLDELVYTLKIAQEALEEYSQGSLSNSKKHPLSK